jgi:hypothetical protein
VEVVVVTTKTHREAVAALQQFITAALFCAAQLAAVEARETGTVPSLRKAAIREHPVVVTEVLRSLPVAHLAEAAERVLLQRQEPRTLFRLHIP